MSCTYDVARDEMFAMVVAYISARAQATMGIAYVPDFRFQGVEYLTAPPADRYWCRVGTQIVREGKGALAGKIFDTAGLLTIQCFGPMNESQVWARLSKLAELALNAVRGNKSASGVWFRNEKRNDNIGNDGKFQRQNVIAEFQFTEQVFVT